MKKIFKSKKAFTLMELIVVIAIIIVLAVAWAYTGRGHVKIAMMNEGRGFIDKIIAQEKDYRNETGRWDLFGSASSYFTARDILFLNTRTNKYFLSFYVTAANVTDNVLTAVLKSTEGSLLTGVYTGSNGNVAFTESI